MNEGLLCEAMMKGFDLLEAALFSPSDEELDDMERQFNGERAVRDALDEQQAFNETPGGVD